MKRSHVLPRLDLIAAGAALCVASAFVVTAAKAQPAGNSQYATDRQNSYVEDATSQGIGTVNMITCIMSAMRPDALVNEPNYAALVDEGKCNAEKGGGNSNQSAASTYMRAVVNSSRASNSAPMDSKIWIPMSEQGVEQLIYVRTRASEAPSSSNPYGVFRLDFCGKLAADGASGACGMMGYIDASATGLQFYQDENQGNGQSLTQLALSQGSGGGTGAGRLARNNPWEGATAFFFAYNATHYRRSDQSNQDMCFSRLESRAKSSVWRYGLYTVDGARVEVNSSFPVSWTDPGDGKVYQGNMGYYGLWMEQDKAASIPNGATVVRQNFDSNTPGQSYTLSKAGGRLTKYTRQTTKLDRIQNIRLNANVQSGMNWSQIEMYWDGTQFVKSGEFQCSQNNGCQTVAVNPTPIANSDWLTTGGIFGWSQSLGGEVFIRDVNNLGNPSQVDVVYRVQSLVYPADMPSSLVCIGNCPTAASIAAYVSPGSPYAPGTDGGEWNWSGVPTGNAISYTPSVAGELVAGGESTPALVAAGSSVANSPQYQWGLRSGKLFDAADEAQVRCDGNAANYCGSKVNDLPSYYVWETGPNSQNQFFALRAPSGNCAGSSDAYCRFDPPLMVTFNVPNDSATYGSYAGRDVILQYAGFGNLWGIPGTCVDRFTNQEVPCTGGQTMRWVPAFSIPADVTTGRVTSGNTTYLVKWLDRELRFDRVSLSECSGLTLPGSELSLPTSAGFLNPGVDSSSNYIGASPTVTAAPRVVHGVVKY